MLHSLTVPHVQLSAIVLIVFASLYLHSLPYSLTRAVPNLPVVLALILAVGSLIVLPSLFGCCCTSSDFKSKQTPCTWFTD